MLRKAITKILVASDKAINDFLSINYLKYKNHFSSYFRIILGLIFIGYWGYIVAISIINVQHTEEDHIISSMKVDVLTIGRSLTSVERNTKQAESIYANNLAINSFADESPEQTAKRIKSLQPYLENMNSSRALNFKLSPALILYQTSISNNRNMDMGNLVVWDKKNNLDLLADKKLVQLISNTIYMMPQMNSIIQSSSNVVHISFFNKKFLFSYPYHSWNAEDFNKQMKKYTKWYTMSYPVNNPYKQTIWSEPYDSTLNNTKTKIITLITPVIYNHIFFGFIAIDYNLSKLRDTISGIYDKKGGLLIVDNTNSVVANSQGLTNNEWVYRSKTATNLSFDARTILNNIDNIHNYTYTENNNYFMVTAEVNGVSTKLHLVYVTDSLTYYMELLKLVWTQIFMLIIVILILYLMWSSIRESREAQKEISNTLDRFSSITNISSDFFWELDSSFHFVYASDRMLEILGVSVEELPSLPFIDVVSRGIINLSFSQFNLLQRWFDAREPVELQMEIDDGNKRYSTECIMKPIIKKGVFHGYHGIAQDITAILKLLQETEKASFTDELTQVGNRRYFFEMMDKEFDRVVRYKIAFSIIIIDCDKFKNVNDTYGHDVGDMVLKNLSNVCTKSLRTSDVFARLGGEEFIFGLVETSLDGAEKFAERLRQEVEKQVITLENGTEVTYRISVGVAAYRITDSNISEIMIRSDHALYEAKETGRNKVVVRY